MPTMPRFVVALGPRNTASREIPISMNRPVRPTTWKAPIYSCPNNHSAGGERRCKVGTAHLQSENHSSFGKGRRDRSGRRGAAAGVGKALRSAGEHIQSRDKLLAVGGRHRYSYAPSRNQSLVRPHHGLPEAYLGAGSTGVKRGPGRVGPPLGRSDGSRTGCRFFNYGRPWDELQSTLLGPLQSLPRVGN